MQKLKNRFTLGKVDQDNFDYVGFRINQDDRGITIDMNKYVKDAADASPITPAIPDRQLTKSESSLYRSLVGKLSWIVQGSISDKHSKL